LRNGVFGREVFGGVRRNYTLAGKKRMEILMARKRTMCLALLLLSGTVHHTYAAGCDAVVGKWAWFTKGVVTINADGTMVHAPGNDGTWTCTDPSRRIVALKWRVGGYVNTMAVSPDGRGLTSTDPAQAFVTGKRIGAAAPNASRPAAAEIPAAPGNPALAVPSPRPVASVSPAAVSQADSAFQEGRRLAASGQYREAIPYFNQAIQANPNHAKAYSDRGRCRAMLGQLGQGLQDLDRAVQIAPNDMSPYFNRAGLRADAGDGEGALADLDKSIRIDPMNSAPRAARAGLFELTGRSREAQLDADTAYRQVDTLMSKKRPIVDQVLRTWRAKRVRASASTPPTGGNPIEVATAAVKAARDRAALAVLDAALLKHPGDEALLTFRGVLHRDIGQAAQAVEDLTAVLQRHPTAQVFLDRGLAYRQLCRFRDEIADYSQAVRQNPQFARAYLERAFTTMRFHKGNDPAPDLTRVIELDPQNWWAFYLRGQEYGYWNNKLHLAMADYRRVVELKPDFAQAYCNMAFALREARRMNEVDGWLQKCYALDPSEREVARKVFAKIQALEELTAREMIAWHLWYLWNCERAGGSVHYGSCWPY